MSWGGWSFEADCLAKQSAFCVRPAKGRLKGSPPTIVWKAEKSAVKLPYAVRSVETKFLGGLPDIEQSIEFSVAD